MAANRAREPETLLGQVISPITSFAKDSERLLNRCTKPTAPEYRKIAIATVIGFLLMGMIGFVVKLVFIPVNNLILLG
eukprot:CAMPEP_0177640372 /NCGR_PEP_ID=MMETSP0447-20121125/6508_1 /TAXON_ID=0 /ORGANISM="Stygamoeba regulata, Strain BSH-02190019" /LENGTH=77 /DNA_ID=CAMNT_0019142439 /DNA_START=56 /DNA_END=289 /DNA_ORIENTATION=-